MSKFVPASDEVRRLFSMLFGGDPTAPKLSDLVGLWLKETVNDASVVAFKEAPPLSIGSDRDETVVDVLLNRVPVASVLDTLCVVRLRRMSIFGVASPADDTFVPATDPTLFEKIWAHIAELDMLCEGFSLIDKPRVVGPNGAPDFRRGYPAFDEIE